MMKRQLFLLAILLVMIFLCHNVESPFRTENLIVWFIVAFDKLERSLSKRVAMIKNIGIVHNFHHAHEQLDNYQILPFLRCVNLKATKKDGPKIIPIGKGNLEKEMIHLLVKLGYKGPFSVLGYVMSEGVELTLKKNLKGIQALFVTK